ncbi:hypothetical protein SDC9_69999 [bioreactor metagenome]|uniref:Uncharacterized protein n=1 Tax=bioreactor metagenome TaxID=1076179 RepID=A0A644Y4N8_9ZZZZ
MSGEYADRERQEAGDCAGQFFADDVTRHRRSRQKLLEVAARHIVHKRAGVRKRRENWCGEEDSVARERFERDGLMREQRRGRLVHHVDRQHIRKCAEQHAKHRAKNA